MSSSPTLEPPAKSLPRVRRFTLRQRILLWMIKWAGYLAIATICRTLRYSISWEDESIAPNTIVQKPGNYSFWHRCVFPAAWMWRNLGIAVMVSRSFDGEYIARIIEKFGFLAVRGSSSRGGAGALLGMREEVAKGAAVAFTIDGPHGPKYVAKPGPVRLSRATGVPMTAFYVGLSDTWILKTWDDFMIPKPFSKALVRVSRSIQVPADATDDQAADYHRQLQAALERITKFAEENAVRVGSVQFPIINR